jgi:hypothetical protein
MKKWLMIIVVLVFASQGWTAPVVSDAGFESYDVADYQFDAVGVPVWTPVSPGWDYFSGAAGTGICQQAMTFTYGISAVEGQQVGSVQCNGDEIAQNISGFVPGKTYVISWAERSRVGYAGNLWVLIDSGTLMASHAVGDTAWVTRNALFTATAATHRLRFNNSSAVWDQMVHIDAVAIVEQAVTVYDSSFESPDVADYQFAAAGTAWTPNTPGWDYWSAADIAGTGISQELGTFMNPVNAYDGDQAGVVWCPGGEIGQTIGNFVPGKTYKVSWAERSRPSYAGDLWVLIDSGTLMASHTVGNTDWTIQNAYFVATSITHRLRFFHSGTWDNMIYIDAVSVVKVDTTPVVYDASFEAFDVADFQFDAAGDGAWTPVSPGWDHFTGAAGAGVCQQQMTFTYTTSMPSMASRSLRYGVPATRSPKPLPALSPARRMS